MCAHPRPARSNSLCAREVKDKICLANAPRATHPPFICRRGGPPLFTGCQFFFSWHSTRRQNVRSSVAKRSRREKIIFLRRCWSGDEQTAFVEFALLCLIECTVANLIEKENSHSNVYSSKWPQVCFWKHEKAPK